jgi:tetratricopeptide (TPR) repeat protein
MRVRGSRFSGALLVGVAVVAAGRPAHAADAATEAPEMPATAAPGDEPAPADPPAAADREAPADQPAAGELPGPTDQPGQADLDAAIEAKLSARALDDYARVLELCKQAKEKGLDAQGLTFADELYTGTLVDRAAMLVDVIYDTAGREPNWPRMRAFAMRDLEEIVERDPTLGQAHLMIARLEALPQGDTERAAAEARKALDLLGDDKLQKARAHVVLAGVADDEKERRAHFDAAVEFSPRDSEIRRARGLFHLVDDEFAAAREDFEVAIEETPDDAGLHEVLGMAYALDDKPEEARRAFDRAITLAPRAAGPLMQRARLLATENDLDAAMSDLDSAVKLAPDEAGARLLRARLRLQSDDHKGAIADVEEVLRRHPDHPAALELRAIMAIGRTDYAAAIRDYRRIIAKRPDDPELVFQLGLVYATADQPRKAIERFSRALELDDEHFPSRRGRSDAEISIGDHEAAIADLEVAITLKPDDTGVLNNLAWLLATSPVDELRDGARAIELATKACEATEWRQAHIISTLAAGYAEQGDFEAARKYSRQAIEAGGVDAQIAEQLRGELESYEANKPVRERQSMEDAELEEAPESDREPPAAEAEPAEPGNAAAAPEQPLPPRRPFDD